MSELKKQFVVQYFDSWIEDEVDYSTEGIKILKTLYIKMELCSGSLRKVINSLKGFKRDYKTIHFFICCEILRELTNAVNYLHSVNIIHRDLKPENVVTTDGRNGVFLKLCDFNIAKILGINDSKEPENDQEESQDHPDDLTRNRGTRYYMAPEMKTGNYGEKSDMFGLALIATEIFNFEDSVQKICPKWRRIMY